MRFRLRDRHGHSLDFGTTRDLSNGALPPRWPGVDRDREQRVDRGPLLVVA
jgi:hypothetical protein